MRFSRILAAFAALLLFAVAVGAQTPAIGAIRGQVTDSAGAPVAGAEVTVTNQATGFSRTTRADAQGRYALPELPLTGTYSLRATREGLATQERADIQLRAGQTAAIDVVLNPAAVTEAITVYGTAEGVQSGSPQLGDRFDAQRIENTPIIGRKLTSLPLLDSAVRPARGTGDLFLNNTLFVINGGGRRQATFTIDGSSADDAWGRQTIFTNVPLAAVQEFTVLTNAFSAEYGRSAGGAINLVTRTGTNDVRGDLSRQPAGRCAGHQAEVPRRTEAGERFLLRPVRARPRLLVGGGGVQRSGPRFDHHLAARPRRLHGPVQTKALLRPRRRRAERRQPPVRPCRRRSLHRHQPPGRGGRHHPAERGAGLPA